MKVPFTFLCAIALAGARQPASDEEILRAARQLSQQRFQGADDLDTTTAEAYRARLSKMCVNAAGAVLGYRGLVRDLPAIAHDQPRTPALVPGSDFFMLFYQSRAPSDQKGNYYALLTRRKDIHDPELRDYQQRLHSEILGSPGKLEPADVIRLALRATHGNYPLAMLTAHNLFKEITEKGRDQVSINTTARNALPAGRAPVDTVGIDLVYGAFASRLVHLRHSANQDKMGPWYHFFIPLAVEAWASRHSAFWMEAGEHGLRDVGLLPNDDHEKQRIDECALRSAYAVHDGLDRRSDRPEQAAEQAPVPPPPAPHPQTGRIRVELVDGFNQDDYLGYIVGEVTLTREDGGAIITMLTEREEEVPAGRYTVRVTPGDYSFNVLSYRDSHRIAPSDIWAPGEEKGVEVKPGETRVVTVRMPSRRGNLSVTVRDEKGPELTGIDVALSGPMSAGPFQSPITFQVAPGNYRVIVPQSTANGKNYRGKEVTAVVVANQARSVTVNLEQVPRLPQPRTIAIAPGWLNLNVGDDDGLVATVYDEQGQEIPDAPVTWSSTSQAVASVDPFGQVTGKGRGQARVVAKSGNASGSIPVTVTSDASPGSCSIADYSKHLPARGGGYVFKAVARDTEGNREPNVIFTWTGSRDDVALVNARTGSITTEAPGDITITARGTAPGGFVVQCSADLTVDNRYQDVLVSGQVLRSDGSAAAGAKVQAMGGAIVPAAADGSFTVMAGKGPHAEGAAITAEAQLPNASGRASGVVKQGMVKGLRINLGAASSQGAPEDNQRRINAHLFRLWPSDKPQDVGFVLYAKSEKDPDGNFLLPDGSGGYYRRAGEDLGFYRDEDSVCAVLRGYGQTSVSYNLYSYVVTCPKEGPVAQPNRAAAAPAPSGVPAADQPTPPAPAPGAQAPAAITEVAGSVTSNGQPVRAQQTLVPGSSIAVGPGSRVSVRFPGGSVAHVAEGSAVTLPPPGPRPAPALELPRGSVEVEHHRETAPSFDSLEVRTPDATIVPTGTRYRVSVSGRGSAFEVLQGSARVTGQMLARTDKGFNVAEKVAFAKTLDLKAGDRAFAFRVPSWLGTGTRTAAAAPLERPDPWNDSQIQQLIDEWLGKATPEAAARYPGAWRYSDWGVVVGPGTTVAGPPDHPAGWSRYQTLWSYRTRFGSLNLCTLGEFVERRIHGKGVEDCARGGGSRPAVPSWMAPAQPAQPAPARPAERASPAPSWDPYARAREQAAREAQQPRPQPLQPDRPLNLEGTWYCEAQNTVRQKGSAGVAVANKTPISIGRGNALELDKRGATVAPRYVRGNTIGYSFTFRLFEVNLSVAYDMELKGDTLAGTGEIRGSDGLLLSQAVTCSGRHDPKK